MWTHIVTYNTINRKDEPEAQDLSHQKYSTSNLIAAAPPYSKMFHDEQTFNIKQPFSTLKILRSSSVPNFYKSVFTLTPGNIELTVIIYPQRIF